MAAEEGDLADFAEIAIERYVHGSMAVILDEETITLSLNSRSPSYISFHFILQVLT
jgi:hypothetical protein